MCVHARVSVPVVGRLGGDVVPVSVGPVLTELVSAQHPWKAQAQSQGGGDVPQQSSQQV